MKAILILICLSLCLVTSASSYPKVDTDLNDYDQTISKMRNEFAQTPANPMEKPWVLAKLDFMYKIDQYMRIFSKTPFLHKYTEEETTFFNEQFMSRFEEMDSTNTNDLKDLLKIYKWFKISEFGETADNQAWLIVQHADNDPQFQKEILSVLEDLYQKNESKPGNYAYLFDRVAAAWSHPEDRTLQRYGTQGQCTGPGTWDPIPMEDPANIDKRRASVGLSTMEEYIQLFKDICH